MSMHASLFGIDISNLLRKTSVKVSECAFIFKETNLAEEVMSDKKMQATNNDKYYNVVSLRYGADIATLIKLRFNEIHRLVVDELNEDNIQNAKPVSAQKLVSLFLEKVTRLLKKDRDFNNMFAEDKELRLWSVMLFLDKSDSLL